MKMSDIPFGTTIGQRLKRRSTRVRPEQAYWRTRYFGDIRVRMVEYTPGTRRPLVCQGHILLCLEGELHTELEDVANSF